MRCREGFAIAMATETVSERDAPTKRSLHTILEKEQEPAHKKGKGTGKNSSPNATAGKRVWGSKRWSKEMEQSASTPVKPSGVKTPDKVRTSIETQTEQTDSITEESVAKRLTAAEEEIRYILNDANKMWKNQTWYNHQLIAMQRKEAAMQYIFTGWTDIPNGCSTEDRDRVISWALMQAGVAQYALDISHQSQIDKLSPISIVTFRNSWQRHRLATFMATLSKTNQGISYWAADGEVSSKVKIKGRIQICTYDRVLGLPLKAALEIIGSNNLGSDTVEKIWKFGELRASSGLIIVKVKTDIEMGISKVFIHKDLFEIFLRGWEAAWNKVTVAPSSSKSNTKSSGKGIAEERRIRVPFEVKLVKFHDYPEDEKVDSEHNVGE